MQVISRFLVFCSGVHASLLKKAPTETQKYMGIGGTVLFTGILAALSAGYALYTIFQSLAPAISFGLLWGLMIFNLDRFIVSSMRKRGKAWAEWKMAIPRLVFAVLLAVVISKPLELKIFEREINRKLDEKKTAFIVKSKEDLKAGFTEITELETKIDTLKSEILQARGFRDLLQQQYDQERFGTKTDGTSGIVGLGTNAKKKEEQLDAAQKSLDEISIAHQARIDLLEGEIRNFMALRQAEFEKQQPGIAGFDGMAARIDALHQLTEESQAMNQANIFIILLFIAVETAPIFVKLISPRGPYDELLDLHEANIAVYTKEETIKLTEKSEGRIEVFRATHQVSNALKIQKTNTLNQQGFGTS
ncbi:DUF4407 domain-containing protein [Rhodonellum sp.]|uniref:DUF4407 domain-containing protein n=1 Tax=Rhodonellum sp. TaxID=2231180 RepID=UPI00272914B8|nr:DUF4407 domain-containing protein [Rhodonellum sp.]MDO9553426.1 DUF4407 domain-containing protein [Rhodonellum sp.]